MIRIVRRYPPPLALSSEKVKSVKETIETMIADGKKPRSRDYLTYWNDPDVRRQLWDMQHGKCCYCERMRDVNRESDVEHFRPKADVTEAGAAHLGYWWLAYEWSNLFFSCRHCNQAYKKNFFPLVDETKRSQGPDDDLSQEEPFLLNPEQDDPEAYIGYDWVGSKEAWVAPYGRDDVGKGKETIRILGLDRMELNLDRARLIAQLRGIVMMMHTGEYLGNERLIERARQLIREETAPHIRYAGFRREYFRAAGLEAFIWHD